MSLSETSLAILSRASSSLGSQLAAVLPTPPTFHRFLQPQVGGHILYGGPRISRASEQRVRKPVEQMEARWIGSATHSGDWSRASTVKPVAEPTTVWGQVCSQS